MAEQQAGEVFKDEISGIDWKAYEEALYQQEAPLLAAQVQGMFEGRGADFGAMKAILAGRLGDLRQKIATHVADQKVQIALKLQEQKFQAAEAQKRREFEGSQESVRRTTETAEKMRQEAKAESMRREYDAAAQKIREEDLRLRKEDIDRYERQQAEYLDVMRGWGGDPRGFRNGGNQEVPISAVSGGRTGAMVRPNFPTPSARPIVNDYSKAIYSQPMTPHTPYTPYNPYGNGWNADTGYGKTVDSRDKSTGQQNYDGGGSGNTNIPEWYGDQPAQPEDTRDVNQEYRPIDSGDTQTASARFPGAQTLAAARGFKSPYRV